jgi:hypothetical protein
MNPLCDVHAQRNVDPQGGEIMEYSFTNLLVLAFVVEVITNFIKNYVPAVKKNGYVSLVAGALGALLCVLTATGIMENTGIEMPYPWLDQLITGVILSRGAGVVHDLSKTLAK